MKKETLILLTMIFVAGCGNPPPVSQTKEQADASTAKRQEMAKVRSEHFIQRGAEALEKRDYAVALKSFDEAIRVNPQDPEGYIVLGETYMHLKSYEKALDTLTAGLQVDPENGRLNYTMAVTHNMLGDQDYAIKFAQKTVEIYQKAKDPENFKRALGLLHSVSNAKKQE